MEVFFLLIIVIIFAFSHLLDKLTEFIKQFKTNDLPKSKNGFTASFSVIPINKKSEDDHNDHPHNN